MLERYRGTLSRVRLGLRQSMLTYFVETGLVPGDVPGANFYDCLERARLCQADVVLCALRINTSASLRLAEVLIGKRIVHCPPALGRYSPPAPRQPTGDDRWVTRVRQPDARQWGRRRLLCCPMYDRVARARVGMSVSHLLSRGLRRRDIRIALRRGYLELSA